METAEGFEAFYLATRDRLVASLAVLVGDVGVAGDAADEAFERALMRWERVSRMDSPAGWTYRVAFNVARRASRRRTQERQILGRSSRSESAPASLVEVRELLDQLPPKQRAAMTLRVLGDLTESDIAEVLGVSRGTVHSALADGRRNLTELLEASTERSHREHTAGQG